MLTWTPARHGVADTAEDVLAAARLVREPACVVRVGGALGIGVGGHLSTSGGLPVVGVLPELYPEWLGDRGFAAAHGSRFPYVAGEMANGISSVEMVVALAGHGLLGFYGAGGQEHPRVRDAVRDIARRVGARGNWGVNLLHGPPAAEAALADVLIAERVPCVSVSAFVALTPAVVRCAVSGLREGAGGRVVRARRVIAKVSRVEVAERFLSPAPPEILRSLRDGGVLTAEEVELAGRIPVADDVTVEADSGGHTDNQSLVATLPAVLAARDGARRRFGYREPVRIGAAGGLGTPEAVAAAFALGAAYVLTGSVNQAAVESGLSADAKEMLARADIGDVAMAPSADMFEQGARVQVLRRGTLFATRATQLGALYRTCASLEDLPASRREKLESEVFRMSLDEVWEHVRAFWLRRDPAQLDRAEHDPRHRMALVFRWYLGSSSRWAVAGDTGRRGDYQMWCGPAMGAFNRWVAGGFMSAPQDRSVVQIALNLLEGAAMVTRTNQVRACGLNLPEAPVPPRRLAL
ncbi:PfaD family polyunsaturated fatty acid/polyketide biosynthesis protein [Saccharothrix syringae]|uniref:PfaD family polyunsaturated fatty acid/polyketide biosynthesis protein n=1 Tax=Saccharothrix syringae TaxID=103733 RepID=A0A5Q0H404_SACSY|nr:PfaD family polyunsaturated fatty acid/polyketide biosynthesis protein [Saccharothrix syringae]QFZ20783.1 PfaD family polyunsaturated fatty acid/polyketide biosynthesis protein [Saccharothrix syringae]